MSGVTVRYIGSGPYCYANSLAMMLGSAAPEPAVIEVLTGSPFGAELLGGVTPFFNPLGWDPGIGLDTAIGLLGWTCRPSAGGSGTEAAARLGEASESRPLLAGPLEFGLLLHHPDSGTAIGSDHYVVVTGVEDGIVRFHDPHGHPYATLPADDFIAAWRADSIGYATEPFTARAGFQRVRDVDPATALRRALPMAARWLAGEADVRRRPARSAARRLPKASPSWWKPAWNPGSTITLATSRSASAPGACPTRRPASRSSARAKPPASPASRHGSSAPCNTRSSPATASPWPGCCGGWRRPMNSCGPACRAAEPASLDRWPNARKG